MSDNLNRNQKLARIAMLGAVTVLLALTPLGYIPIVSLGLTVTLMVVPVALGGLVMGMPTGLLLGLLFGISSVLRAPTEPFGILLLQQSVILCILACILPRVVVGLVADFAHTLIRKHKSLRKLWFYAATGLVCSLTNTILFLGFIWLAFDSSKTGITGSVLLGLVGFNGLIEAGVNAFAVGLLGKALLRKVQ